MNEPLFSLTKKDFRIDTFRCPGKGGQKVNKTSSGVRITHLETGIAYSCTETRFQQKNRELAFKKLCKDKMFLLWLKNKAFKVTTLEDEIDELMVEENLKIETRKNNKWANDEN